MRSLHRSRCSVGFVLLWWLGCRRSYSNWLLVCVFCVRRCRSSYRGRLLIQRRFCVWQVWWWDPLLEEDCLDLLTEPMCCQRQFLCWRKLNSYTSLCCVCALLWSLVDWSPWCEEKIGNRVVTCDETELWALRMVILSYATINLNSENWQTRLADSVYRHVTLTYVHLYMCFMTGTPNGFFTNRKPPRWTSNWHIPQHICMRRPT